MAKSDDKKPEGEKRKVDTAPFVSKLTLERNEKGELVPMVEGIAIEGVLGIMHQQTTSTLSLTLYLDPAAVNYTTKGRCSQALTLTFGLPVADHLGEPSGSW